MQKVIKPHIVFLDIDGTTLDPKTNLPSELLCRVIRAGQKRGHKFFINSGRDIGIIPQAFIQKGGFDGVCCGMGIYAEYHETMLFEERLPEETMREWIHYCTEHGEAMTFDSSDKADCSRYSYGDSGFLHAEYSAYTEEDFFRMIDGKTFHYKTTVPYTPCPAFAEFLNRYIGLIYCTADSYAEGSKIGCSKGTAIDSVCRALSIPIERSIAVGDSENDLGMLLTAGVSVAMGNAPESVKKACDLVTDTLENDGAAKAIIDLLALDVAELSLV